MHRSTVMGLHPRRQFTLRDLLYGMMLPSGNDAALAIGRHLSGSDAAFVAEMNALAERAWALGHPLRQRARPRCARPPHVRTRPRDALALCHEPAGLRRSRRRGVLDRDRLPSRSRSTTSTPSSLDTPAPTASRPATPAAPASTLAASAVRGGHRVYVVLLNAPQRESDAYALMDWAFASFKWPVTGMSDDGAIS